MAVEKAMGSSHGKRKTCEVVDDTSAACSRSKKFCKSKEAVKVDIEQEENAESTASSSSSDGVINSDIDGSNSSEIESSEGEERLEFADDDDNIEGGRSSLLVSEGGGAGSESDDGDSSDDDNGNEVDDDDDELDVVEAQGNMEALKELSFGDDLPHDRDVLRHVLETVVKLASKGSTLAKIKAISKQEIPSSEMDTKVSEIDDNMSSQLQSLTRKELIQYLKRIVVKYYGYNIDLAGHLINLFGPAEAFEFFEANEKPRPIVLRTNTLKTKRKELAKALIARGANVDPLGPWTKEGLIVLDSTVPVGATPEYLAGHYILQSASSFLPVIALDPKPDEHILDMAAAPGGKSTHIAQLMRNSGVLYCNDAKESRSAALVANLFRLGVRNAVVTCMDGRRLSKYIGPGSLDRVLIDAPCTGLGVISKDVSVKYKRSVEDFKKSSIIQKELLLEAIDTVNAKSKTGGIIVYSTCSVSIEENECVVAYALKTRNVKLIETGLTFGTKGFVNIGQHKFDRSMELTRRFYPHKNNMDGFFVAKFKKYDNAIPVLSKRDRSSNDTQPAVNDQEQQQ